MARKQINIRAGFDLAAFSDITTKLNTWVKKNGKPEMKSNRQGKCPCLSLRHWLQWVV
jgi:hypothetical protein